MSVCTCVCVCACVCMCVHVCVCVCVCMHARVSITNSCAMRKQEKMAPKYWAYETAVWWNPKYPAISWLIVLLSAHNQHFLIIHRIVLTYIRTWLVMTKWLTNTRGACHSCSVQHFSIALGSLYQHGGVLSYCAGNLGNIKVIIIPSDGQRCGVSCNV